MFASDTTPLKFGLLGKTLKHSLSPEIHHYIYNQLGINGSYDLIELSEKSLGNIRELMGKEGFTGLNVTIPYKEAVMPFLDVIDKTAKWIGAVNTIYRKGDLLIGTNTDYIGILKMFQRFDVSLDGKKVVILGSGGSAKAVVYALQLAKVRSITLAARNEIAGKAMIEQFQNDDISAGNILISFTSLEKIPTADIVINTTPVGMYPNEDACPIKKEDMGKFKVAADLIYNPLTTQFLQIAQEKGLQVVSGLWMLIEQALAAEEIWLHREIKVNDGEAFYRYTISELEKKDKSQG